MRIHSYSIVYYHSFNNQCTQEYTHILTFTLRILVECRLVEVHSCMSDIIDHCGSYDNSIENIF